MASPESKAPDMFGTGLRSAGQLDQPASHRVLVARRLEQPFQPAPALLLPPPPCPRRGMAGGEGGRSREVHSTGSGGEKTRPLGGDALGRLSPRCLLYSVCAEHREQGRRP